MKPLHATKYFISILPGPPFVGKSWSLLWRGISHFLGVEGHRRDYLEFLLAACSCDPISGYLISSARPDGCVRSRSVCEDSALRGPGSAKVRTAETSGSNIF